MSQLTSRQFHSDLPHRHDFQRVAIKQVKTNKRYNGIPPVILAHKCKTCGYREAYDLMNRNDFERLRNDS